MFRSYEVSSVFTVFWAFVLAITYAQDWRMGALTSRRCWPGGCFQPVDLLLHLDQETPVKEIVESTETGPATTILSGLSVGMESSVWALIVIVISFIMAM